MRCYVRGIALRDGPVEHVGRFSGIFKLDCSSGGGRDCEVWRCGIVSEGMSSNQNEASKIGISCHFLTFLKRRLARRVVKDNVHAPS